MSVEEGPKAFAYVFNYTLEKLIVLWAYVLRVCPSCDAYPVDVEKHTDEQGLTIKVNCENCGYKASWTFPTKLGSTNRRYIRCEGE